MTLLGRIQDGRPIQEGLVDANPEEAFAMYTLYENYREASKLELACAALNQAIHTQTGAQKKIHYPNMREIAMYKTRFRSIEGIEKVLIFLIKLMATLGCARREVLSRTMVPISP